MIGIGHISRSSDLSSNIITPLISFDDPMRRTELDRMGVPSKSSVRFVTVEAGMETRCRGFMTPSFLRLELMGVLFILAPRSFRALARDSRRSLRCIEHWSSSLCLISTASASAAASNACSRKEGCRTITILVLSLPSCRCRFRRECLRIPAP